MSKEAVIGGKKLSKWSLNTPSSKDEPKMDQPSDRAERGVRAKRI